MGLRNPPHPGRSIRRDCLEALGLTVTDGAKILGITEGALRYHIKKGTIKKKWSLR